MQDGVELTQTIWPADGTAIGTVVVVHGLGEYSGRYSALAADLCNAGWEVHATDLRGHGRSPGARGSIPSATAMQDDIRAMAQFARTTTPGPVIVLGHSMGGAFAAAALARQPTLADGLVMSSPALRADLSVVQRILMTTMLQLGPNIAVNNGLDPNYLSHDRAVVDAYTSDPLVHDRVSSRLAHAILTAGEQVRAAASTWCVPTLLLYSGDDHLVNASGSDAFAAAAPPALVTTRRFDRLYHETFNETERAEPVATLLTWLTRFAQR
jgi:alpha-beta hydrolase superfamily lysophospholipase